MPPIDTTALAAIFTWVWDQYGKTIVDRTGKAVWERLRWEDRAMAYGQKVQRLYGTTQMLGQARPVSLEGAFTAIYLLDKLTASRRYTVAEMEEEFIEHGYHHFHSGREPNRQDGLAMVRGGENLFIFGKPGAGKTTFLKYLALKGVSGELKRVPIFIGLKQLVDSGLTVFDFVVREFDVCDFPDAGAYLNWLLKSGRAILLFDGLDEVNVADDERARLTTAVEAFARKYNKCQRLITCRLAANEYSFQNCIYVEMADFNEDQIREFVAKWFSGSTKHMERRDLFLSELDKAESEGLRELARVPLLLALLCLGFEETLKLSSRRAELYEEALDALLKKWDAGRYIRRDEIYRELSLKRKEQMLAQVAAETFDRAEHFIPERTLAQSLESFLMRVPNAPMEIDGRAVLHTIVAQHGLFVERARGIYSFAHLTFQEYFTARYVVENEARGTLRRLIERYADPRYREVFLLTAAQLPDASEFFSLFIERLANDARSRPAVAALLSQIARKARTIISEAFYPVDVRSAYLALALALARNLNRARDLDLAFALAFEISPVITRDRALDLARDLALAHDPARAYDLVRTCNRALVRAGDRIVDPALARDTALANTYLIVELITLRSEEARSWLDVAHEWMSVAITQSAALGDAEMQAHLVTLVELIPSALEGQKRGQLAAFTAELQSILAALDLIFPNLEEKDWDLLSQYMDGNRFLLLYLEQAVIADRKAIKDRLLILPDA